MREPARDLLFYNPRDEHFRFRRIPNLVSRVGQTFRTDEEFRSRGYTKKRESASRCCCARCSSRAGERASVTDVENIPMDIDGLSMLKSSLSSSGLAERKAGCERRIANTECPETPRR